MSLLATYRTRVTVLLAGMFLSLVAARWDVLAAAPGMDQAPLWIEGEWLYQNGFDYDRLRADEAHYDDGGPRGYVATIFSPLITLLIGAGTSPRQAFVLYRLMSIFCGALAAVCVAKLVDDRLKHPVAWLSAAATVTFPMYLQQIQQLGIEAPMSAAALVSAVLVSRNRRLLAVAATLVAFFSKSTGIVVTGALAGFFVLDAIHSPSHRKNASIAAVLTGMCLVLEANLVVWSDAVASRLVPVVHVFPTIFRVNPDVIVLIAVASPQIAFAISDWRRSIRRSSLDDELPIWMSSAYHWAVITGIFIATSTVTYHARYLSLAVPFLFVELGRAVRWYSDKRSPGFGAFALSVIIALDLANSHGKLLPTLPGPWSTIPAFSERSLEYWEEDRWNAQIIGVLAEYSELPVFLPEMVVDYAATPWLGLVERSLHGYTPFETFAYPSFRNVRSILKDRPKEVIVVAAERPFETTNGFRFTPPEPSDEILLHRRDRVEWHVYRHRFSSEPDAHIRWLARQLQPSVAGLAAALHGERNGAAGLLASFVELNPAVDVPADVAPLLVR